MVRGASLFVGGMLALVLAAEVVLRVLPVPTATQTGYHTDPLILNYPPHHRWSSATGWDLRNAQPMQANAAGFASSREFERNPQAVVLIGDSFIEASMLPEAERPGAQLERMLGGRPVFAMGGPGSALLDYAERIRFAHERYGVRDFVLLLERGDVKQSLCGSGNIHGPCLDAQTLLPRTETLPEAGLAKRALRHSALAQYLVGQLRISPQRLWAQVLAQSRHSMEPASADAAGRAQQPSLSAGEKAQIDAVASTFFARALPHVGGRLVLVLDGERSAGSQSRPVEPDPAREHFIALARQSGAQVVDMAPLFRTHLQGSALKLEVGPYDAHLNALGLGIAMQAAARVLAAPR